MVFEKASRCLLSSGGAEQARHDFLPSAVRLGSLECEKDRLRWALVLLRDRGRHGRTSGVAGGKLGKTLLGLALRLFSCTG